LIVEFLGWERKTIQANQLVGVMGSRVNIKHSSQWNVFKTLWSIKWS